MQNSKELREYWREKLSGTKLDELFEEAKTCGHEGSCWDLINMLADILVPETQSLITRETERARVDEAHRAWTLIGNSPKTEVGKQLLSQQYARLAALSQKAGE